VDLPLRHVQIDAVECDDIAERLGDPTCPDCEGCIHGSLLHVTSKELKDVKKRRQGQLVERSENER